MDSFLLLIVVALALLLTAGVILLFTWLRRSAPPRATAPARSVTPRADDDLARQVRDLRTQVSVLESRMKELERRPSSTRAADLRDETYELRPEAAIGWPPATPPSPREPGHRVSELSRGESVFAPPSRQAIAPATDAEAIAALSQDADALAALDRYNQLAAAGDRKGLQRFMADYDVVALAETAADELSEDADGLLWWVDVGSETHGLLLPAGKVIQDWDKLYRSLAGANAKKDLGTSFELRSAERLRIVTPAWARRTGGPNRRRVARGVLEGV